MSRVIDEHRQYLCDATRVAAFAQAIDEVVSDGAVVLDLGSGTGILGLLAARAGAARVYSVESDSIIEVARAIARANGFDERIVFIKGISSRIDLPEEVDVIVGDQIGRMGFEAGLLTDLVDARERFLKPNGKLIPQSVDMLVCAVETPEMWERISFWDHKTEGFDWEPARRISTNTGYPAILQRDNLLGKQMLVTRFDTLTSTGAPFSSHVRLQIERDGTLHGVGLWFAAKLSPSAVMTNAPLAAQRINRRNVFLPIEQPVIVKRDDYIELGLHVRPGDLIVTWKLKIWRCVNDTAKLIGDFSQSTFKGMLIAREAMERTEPTFVPRLNAWGEARLSILTLCDGRRTLAEIEREVYRRHPQLFGSEGEAMGFVAEVVPGYSI